MCCKEKEQLKELMTDKEVAASIRRIMKSLNEMLKEAAKRKIDVTILKKLRTQDYEAYRGEEKHSNRTISFFISTMGKLMEF